MYTKTIVMTKRSCRGKEFTCIRETTVMDEFELEKRRRERYARLKTERDFMRADELRKYEIAMNPTSLRKIMNAYDEYIASENYY